MYLGYDKYLFIYSALQEVGLYQGVAPSLVEEWVLDCHDCKMIKYVGIIDRYVVLRWRAPVFGLYLGSVIC